MPGWRRGRWCASRRCRCRRCWTPPPARRRIRGWCRKWHAWCCIATTGCLCWPSRPACPARAAPASRAISTACWRGCARAASTSRGWCIRLDRDTSGVILVARTPGVAAKLAAGVPNPRGAEGVLGGGGWPPGAGRGPHRGRSGSRRRLQGRAHRAGRAVRQGGDQVAHRLSHARSRCPQTGLAGAGAADRADASVARGIARRSMRRSWAMPPMAWRRMAATRR